MGLVSAELAAARLSPHHRVVNVNIHNWDEEVADAYQQMVARRAETGCEHTVEFHPVDYTAAAQLPRNEYVQNYDGQWQASISKQNACCDCGLVHNYEYRVVAADATDPVAVEAASVFARAFNEGRIRMEVRSWENPQASARVRETQHHDFQKVDK